MNEDKAELLLVQHQQHLGRDTEKKEKKKSGDTHSLTHSHVPQGAMVYAR